MDTTCPHELLAHSLSQSCRHRSWLPGIPTGDAEGLRECEPYDCIEGTQDKQDCQSILRLDRPICPVFAGYIQSYHTERLQEGRADGKGGLSARSVVYHRILLRALDYACHLLALYETFMELDEKFTHWYGMTSAFTAIMRHYTPSFCALPMNGPKGV